MSGTIYGILPPEVPAAGYPELVRAQNGFVTDGTHMAAMAQSLNMIASKRMKVLYHAYTPTFYNPSTAWYGRFYCSPYPSSVYAAVLTGDSGTPVTGDFFMTVDGVAQARQSHQNTTIVSDTRVQKLFRIVDGSGADIAAGSHDFHIDLSGAAAIRAVVIFEAQRLVTNTGNGAVDPSQFSVGAPVTGANINALTEYAWTLFKSQSTTQFSWSSPRDPVPTYRVTGTTWTNPLDATTTGFATTAAGFYVWPYRQATMTGTTVPVTFWVYAVAGSNTGRVRFSNSAGVICTITGIGAAGYYTGTGTLDPTLTSDLIVPEYSNATAGQTIDLYGMGCYNLTT